MVRNVVQTGDQVSLRNRDVCPDIIQLVTFIMGRLLFINDWIQLDFFIKKFTLFYLNQVKVARNHNQGFLVNLFNPDQIKLKLPKS